MSGSSRGGGECSKECWTSASEHPPQRQSRIGIKDVFWWVVTWL